MSQFVNKIYRNNTIIYKIILFLLTTISIVYLFSKGGQFKYDFSNGQLWKYDNLYAPFDFSIQKTNEEIAIEKKKIISYSKKYFEYDSKTVLNVNQNFEKKIASLSSNDSLSVQDIGILKKTGENILEKIYEVGFLEVFNEDWNLVNDELIALKKENEVSDVLFSNLLTSKDILTILNKNLGTKPYNFQQELLLNILVNVTKPNVFFDKEFTNKIIENDTKQISMTQGRVASGELIIQKGGIVEGKKLAILNSLKT